MLEAKMEALSSVLSGQPGRFEDGTVPRAPDRSATFDALRVVPSASQELAQLGAPRARAPQIYAFDNYNGDVYGGLGHGEVIAAYMQARLGLPVRRIDIRGDRSSTVQSMNNISAGMQSIVAAPGRLDHVYINISFGFSAKGVERNSAAYDRMSGLIAEATRRGARIFVASGNDWPNEMSKIPGVITVGASAVPLAPNREIDVRRPGIIDIIPVPGGYDLTRDGRADVPALNPGGAARPNRLAGSSAAAPEALVDTVLGLINPSDRN
jgi:hypothetical protein